MDDKYKNLREKTVFDFCDDPEILEKADVSCDKEDYNQYNFFGKAINFLELAYVLNDKTLKRETEKQFPEELARLRAQFNE